MFLDFIQNINLSIAQKVRKMCKLNVRLVRSILSKRRADLAQGFLEINIFRFTEYVNFYTTFFYIHIYIHIQKSKKKD